MPDMTVAEVAEYTGLSTSHIANLCRRQELDAVKDGKLWYISQASADQYLREHAATKTAPELQDALTMERLYQTLGTFRAVAEHLHCSKESVAQALHRHGIPITNRRQAAEPPFVPRRVSLERWMDVAIILLQHGIRPQKPAQMCPPNCPGRGECLTTKHCVLDENGKLVKSVEADERNRQVLEPTTSA